MLNPFPSVIAIAFGLLFGVFALFSPDLPLQLLGGLTILTCLAYGYAQWRARRRDPQQVTLKEEIPALSFGERHLAWIFVWVAIALVVLMAISTFT